MNNLIICTCDFVDAGWECLCEWILKNKKIKIQTLFPRQSVNVFVHIVCKMTFRSPVCSLKTADEYKSQHIRLMHSFFTNVPPHQAHTLFFTKVRTYQARAKNFSNVRTCQVHAQFFINVRTCQAHVHFFTASELVRLMHSFSPTCELVTLTRNFSPTCEIVRLTRNFSKSANLSGSRAIFHQRANLSGSCTLFHHRANLSGSRAIFHQRANVSGSHSFSDCCTADLYPTHVRTSGFYGIERQDPGNIATTETIWYRNHAWSAHLGKISNQTNLYYSSIYKA